MEKIRTFIAIELPGDLKLELGRLQEKLKVDKPRVKWVSPESIHLTLKFLGDVEPSMISSIRQVMTEAVQGIQHFDLRVQQLGVFPSPERAQVVWVGLGGDLESLNRLCRQLEDNLAKIGFPAEKHGFTPHLTLARLGDEVLPDERRYFGEFITKSHADINYDIRASALSLMKSQLTREGAIYTRLSLVEFDKKL
ncbi:MAG: RNA 2',3'-cyclic phosphodiesterase [Dehalococcoidales bacterium]|jgi:2'-5' RNA ligase|nr:RNA 2',3'-cyclic phosphodiesterase [Dehalococcoidales bacterium]